MKIVMETKDLYTIKDVMDRFNVSRQTVYNWIKVGKLHPIKFTNRTLFRREEVDVRH